MCQSGSSGPPTGRAKPVRVSTCTETFERYYFASGTGRCIQIMGDGEIRSYDSGTLLSVRPANEPENRRQPQRNFERIDGIQSKSQDRNHHFWLVRRYYTHIFRLHWNEITRPSASDRIAALYKEKFESAWQLNSPDTSRYGSPLIIWICLRRAHGQKTGDRVYLQELLMPSLRDSYENILESRAR